jgi:hypothetical protein
LRIAKIEEDGARRMVTLNVRHIKSLQMTADSAALKRKTCLSPRCVRGISIPALGALS